MKSNILIIGGTGFIGSHLCEKAYLEGFKVTSLSLNKVKKKNKLHDISYINLDLNNISKLKNFLNFPYEYVVNLSGYIDHKLFYLHL